MPIIMQGELGGALEIHMVQFTYFATADIATSNSKIYKFPQAWTIRMPVL